MILRSTLCILILASIFLSTSHFHIEDSPHESYGSECTLCIHRNIKNILDFTIKEDTYFMRIFTLKLPSETHELIFIVSDLSARSPPFLII